MKKFPRKEVLEKQLAVVTEELEAIHGDDLENVDGGQSLGSIATNVMRMGIMYGVPLPLYRQFAQRLFGGGSEGSGGPKAQ